MRMGRPAITTSENGHLLNGTVVLTHRYHQLTQRMFKYILLRKFLISVIERGFKGKVLTFLWGWSDE